MFKNGGRGALYVEMGFTFVDNEEENFKKLSATVFTWYPNMTLFIRLLLTYDVKSTI